MLIGTYFIEDEKYDIICENNKYYSINTNLSFKKEMSKLDVAQIVSSYWSFDLINNYVDEKNQDKNFKVIKDIPIYDWISLELYGYGKNKEEATKEVETLFDDFIHYYKKFEINKIRNLENFMKKVTKFAYFPKDRKSSFDFNDLELIIDSKKTLTSFRDFAINNGIPNDARADEPIFGYVDGNNIVFSKFFFLKGQKEKYIDFIKHHYEDIAKSFHLKDYNVFLNVKCVCSETNGLDDSYIYKDFDYYRPINQLEKVC
jgi:hypothetical protein